MRAKQAGSDRARLSVPLTTVTTGMPRSSARSLTASISTAGKLPAPPAKMRSPGAISAAACSGVQSLRT